MNFYPSKNQLTNDSENSSSIVWAVVIDCSANVLPTVSKLNTRDGKDRCPSVVEVIWVNADSLISADVHWAASSSSVLPCDSGNRNCICHTCECNTDGHGGTTNVHSLVLRRRRDYWCSWKKERVIMASTAMYVYSWVPLAHWPRFIVEHNVLRYSLIVPSFQL